MGKIAKLVVVLSGLVVAGMGLLFMLGYLSSGRSKGETPQSQRQVVSPTLKSGEEAAGAGFVVSTSTKEATQIGKTILSQGGNAVDAAIAISYALAVSEPYGSGIGGGGGLLIYSPEWGYKAIDYRDRAPRSQEKLDPTMPGVPGFVAGMSHLADTYGTQPLAELIKPSLILAEEGFTVSSIFARFIKQYGNLLATNPDYLNAQGRLYQEGETMTMPTLAQVLKQIMTKGNAGFYRGNVAKAIAQNSWLETSDLEQVKVEERQAHVVTIFGHELATMPAPFSGPTLGDMLSVVDHEGLPNPETDADKYLQAYRQVKQQAYDTRKRTITDPDFPTVQEVSQHDGSLTESGQAVSNGLDVEEQESTNTTHFTIIDQTGMAVSATNTLGYFFGSGIAVEGMYLNSAMRSFSQTGKGINSYAAGKKPRNFTAPTIINETDGELTVIGTPGGNMIPEFLFQVLVDHYLFETSWELAVAKNRLNLLSSGRFLFEDNQDRPSFVASDKTLGELKISDDYFGSIQLVTRDKHGKLVGVADSRREGAVAIQSE